MNFVGTGKRLKQGDIGEAARALGISTAVLLAFLEVEAAGRGFDNRNRLKMLRETHKFYDELRKNAVALAKAIKAGVATKSWTRNYKSDSYPDLERMIAIGGLEAALRSCSWGLPQILGSNCNYAGFANAEQMVKTMLQGEREQLFAMVTLMRQWGMRPMLTGRDFTKADSWREAAKKYNGSGYATHEYHTKLAAAYVKHAGTDGNAPMTPVEPGTTLLTRGMKGEAVRNLQNDLAALGYVFKAGIDGRFGAETESNVRAFQRKAGLSVDGKAGGKTLLAIADAIAHMKVDKSPAPPEWERNGGGLLAAFFAWLFNRG